MALQIKRFDFGSLQDFREPFPPLQAVMESMLPEVVEEETPPPPPVFSEGELEQAKRKAFEEGRTAGVAEEKARQENAAQMREQSIQRSCDTLAVESQRLLVDLAGWRRLQIEELRPLVLMLARKIAGDALVKIPEAGIDAMLHDCLGILQAQPKIILKVCPTLIEPMRARLSQLLAAHHLECEFQLLEDETMKPGEAALVWKDGSANRNLDTLWQQIQTMLEGIDFMALADAPLPKPEDPFGQAIKGENHE